MHISHSDFKDSLSPDQLALILSDNPLAVSTIREFLVTHGCTIALSPSELRDSSYLIVCGMYDFVKSSLAKISHAKGKILIILI